MKRQFGAPLGDWKPPATPLGQVLTGQYAELEPLDATRHSSDLHAANQQDAAGDIWDYLPYGPFGSLDEYSAWVREIQGIGDPFFYAIKDLETGRYCGVASFLRINPASGSIEVGHINFAPALQRTRAATEAMYLMMQWAFAAGYRRYEWKCDALNGASRRAALRLGLSYEGVFRQATVYKGRNRDTAWFAAIDKEWPTLQEAYQSWLQPSNFDAAGGQKTSLGTFTAKARI